MPLVTLLPHFISPTLQEVTITTDNWENYTSQVGLFSFMYPNSYVLHENELRGFEANFEPAQNAVELEADNTIPESEKAYLPYDIRIFFEKVQNGISLDEYIDKNSTCHTITAETGKQYTIAGFSSSMIFENTPCGTAGGSSVIYLMHAGMVYRIVVADYMNTNTRKFLDQFLSTFKFTK